MIAPTATMAREEEAIAIAHWPGQETKQCEKHCKALASFSLSMFGSKLLFTSLETGLTLEVISGE